MTAFAESLVQSWKETQIPSGLHHVEQPAGVTSYE